MTATKELQVKEKQELSSPVEQTRPGLMFTPTVDMPIAKVLSLHEGMRRA